MDDWFRFLLTVSVMFSSRLGYLITVDMDIVTSSGHWMRMDRFRQIVVQVVRGV